jgi:hypothetical protein
VVNMEERDILSQALKTGFDVTAMCVRMQMASMLLPGSRPAVAARMDDWLARMLSPNSPVDETVREFGVSVTADLGRLTWTVSGEAGAMIPVIGEYLTEVGVSEAELDRLAEADEAIQPARLGSWIECRGESLDLGWLFPVEMPLVQALDVVEPSVKRDQVGEWAARQGLETCSCLGRSLGVGHPYTQLCLPLPKTGLQQQLVAALEAFSSLSVPALSDQVVLSLLQGGPANLALSLWLSAKGLVKIGLVLPQPETWQVLHLCRALRIDEDEMLAAFEGALGVEGPNAVEVQSFAGGSGIELHYRARGVIEDEIVLTQ